MPKEKRELGASEDREDKYMVQNRTGLLATKLMQFNNVVEIDLLFSVMHTRNYHLLKALFCFLEMWGHN